jgi:hypothetical protein
VPDVPALVPAAPALGWLDPLAPLVALVVGPETLLHGATVAELREPPLGVIVTPATLQFAGMRCSIISTKLSALPPVEAPCAPAPRMSMNTTVSPLLAMFRKVPAIIGRLLVLDAPAEAAGEAAALEAVVVEAPAAPEAVVNVPDHWFCVSSC